MRQSENQKCESAQTLASVGDADIGSPLTADQLKRWAVLIADGQDQFPQALSSADQQRLVTEVRRLLREQLLSFVAGAIARDIRRRERHDMEVHRDPA